MSTSNDNDPAAGAVADGPPEFHERFSEIVDELESRMAAEIALDPSATADGHLIGDI